MSSEDRPVLDAVRRYFNDPKTVDKFALWAPDPKRPGIWAAHLGLDDVERFHTDPIRRAIEYARHKKAVERMTNFIVTACQIEDGNAVLDAGCGTGSVSFPIAEKYPSTRVFGVSLSHSQLEIALKYQQSAGVKNAFFTEQNYTKLALADNSLDRVIFIESFCHAADKKATVEDAYRVLKPGGKLCIFDALYVKQPTAEQQPLCDMLGSTEGLAMAKIFSVDELVGTVKELGMEVEHVEDLTGKVKASLALIANGYVRALVEGRSEPSAVIDSYLAWHLLTDQGALGYALVRSVKPSQ